MLQHDYFQTPHTFKGIPKGQIICARKICSEDHEYQKQKMKLVDKFVAKGYNHNELVQIGDEIGRTNKEQFLQPRSRESARR